MVNIKQVALKAGVSPSTVSRVISGNGYVSEETRNKVMRVVREVKYSPNVIAKSLKQGRTNTVALIFPSIQNHMFPDIVRGAEDVARKNGMTIVLCNTNEDQEIEKEYINKLKTRWIDGFIVCSMYPNADHIRELKKEGFPLALAMRHYNDGIDTVSIDHFRAGYDATDYLIKTGCRRIAVALGPRLLNIYKGRLEGYMQALRDHNIAYDSSLLMYESGGVDCFYELTADMIKSGKNIDAIFAMNDSRAIVCIRAILDMGLNIPDDIAVIGIDDITESSLIEPTLTTIKQPFYEIGVAAMQKLLRQINCKENGLRYVSSLEIMNTELMVRASTRRETP